MTTPRKAFKHDKSLFAVVRFTQDIIAQNDDGIGSEDRGIGKALSCLPSGARLLQGQTPYQILRRLNRAPSLGYRDAEGGKRHPELVQEGPAPG